MKRKPFVSFVVHANLIDQDLEQNIERLSRFLGENFERYEVVLVDNSGLQASAMKAKQWSQHPGGHLVWVKLKRKESVEVSVLAGLDRAMGDFVYQMDFPTFDFKLELLTELFDQAVTGTDVVSATRTQSRIGLLPRLFYWIFDKLSHLNLSLQSESLTLISRRALDSVLASKQRFRYHKAILAVNGYTKSTLVYQSDSTVPIQRRSLREQLSLGMEVLISYSTAGFRLGLLISSLFILLSVTLTGYAIWSYYYRDNVNSGWASLMVFMSVGFGGLFLFLSLVSEYLRRILSELQAQPIYVVETSVLKKAPTE